MAKFCPVRMLWSGISPTIGASLTGVTMNIAGSESLKGPGSVAVNVIVSLLFHSGLITVIVAT